MICCCKRKTNNNFQMLNLQRNVHNETKFLNNIYDHILIPYDNNNVVPETPPKQIMKSKRKSNIYVNFFEQNAMFISTFKGLKRINIFWHHQSCIY